MLTSVREKEIKSFPALITKAEGDDGIVEAIVSVIGNIDQGLDIIHPGSFTKTIHERGGKIKFVDSHNINSSLDGIALIISIQEIGRDKLPPELLDEVPDAQGGLLVKAQFMMDDSISAGIFRRIKIGIIDQYSIGFEIIQSDISEVDDPGGNAIQIRNIREIKLWEISSVLFAMNDATMTINTKKLPFTIADLPQPGIRKQDEFSCTGCTHYGHVSDQIGYCKSYDVGTYPVLCCDDYDQIAPTVGESLKGDALEFVDSLIDLYESSGVWTNEDVARAKQLQPLLGDAIVDLFPKELTSRQNPSSDVSSDIEDTEIDDDEQPEPDNKSTRIREAMLLRHKIQKQLRGQS